MIRSARPDERSLLIELQRRASLMWKDDRAALLAEPDAIDIPPYQIAEGHVSVWDEGGRVLGFVTTLPRDDGAVELDGLYVEPGHWGGGVGRALVDHALAAARAQGAISLNLVANAHALGFYEKCGFQALGEVETRFSRGVRMLKPL